MPVSQKPRRKKGESGGPSPYSVAGTLLYGFFAQAEIRKRQHRVPTQDRLNHIERVTKRRRSSTGHAGCDLAGSRPAERRKRQGAHLHQHPSVVARFSNHPTPAQNEEAAARIEALPKSKRAPRKKAAAA
ncbi:MULTISPECIES: hypothetical protein [unclassified Methylobacterium]|uniref:hypothetical protein n=1 Tax=unclassified Methylobacterium TaxID=2615210 RepID=UPI0011C1DCBC|nr:MULTISPECIES: hypothetical protein [unclassified Methylobacterium]QEE37984.1 hypothetical protein FVA80_02365 [Methylobacterium sp. WL1]TXN59824.1 hypothetical protein FV241_00195 [Methylobacterium sp. WL2]